VMVFPSTDNFLFTREAVADEISQKCQHI